ncbi:hypothetical protein BDU57DRAFT_541962 [Ampelomyces quisqualis]|uniref:Uncharacterized protein n=1 Tax=Ampelomyces quisqualis TaxID=50730 RepID=A0A6A5QDB3_AMPQU|nr:hypothetical protein BDU57DRAFT_541962 [Ampelomyces quisqualis]
MQLTLLTAAIAATVSANVGKTAVQLNKEADLSKPNARVINRCDYDVYVWSVWKNMGCGSSEMVHLKKGQTYSENYQHPQGGDQGVSIKISKTQQCTGSNIVQLEYFQERRSDMVGFHYNYIDVSYVDCLGGDCPTKNEGYYLSSGTSSFRAMKATSDNSWCPVLSCHDAASCAKMSYIMPDDVQTKTCDLDASLDFYLCGSEPPSDNDSAPASSKKAHNTAHSPSTTAKATSTAAGYDKGNAPAVTAIAEHNDNKPHKVTTKVVYVTAYEYVNAKRAEHGHAYAHARRHQSFHA